MSTAVWLRRHGDGVVLALHVQPGARTTEIAGEHGGALKIRLAAPPVEGRANSALLAFLADRLALPKARLELVAGHSSRAKQVRVATVDAEDVIARLAPPATGCGRQPQLPS